MRKNENLTHFSDDELIRWYQNTSKPEYAAELYGRYAHMVYGVCLKYLKNQEDCKDCTMLIFEKFLVAIRNKEVFSCQNYLYIIARNECLTTLAKNEQKRKQIKNWRFFRKNRPVVAENDDFYGHLNEKLEKNPEDIVRKAINLLPENQKECISLFYYNKLSYKQIAEEQNTSPLVVKGNLQNAKRNLRNILASFK